MRTLAERIAAAVTGLLAALLLLEAGLAVAGAWSGAGDRRPARRDAAAVTVLCAGDSFVAGAGAPREKSFPRQLEVLLRARYTGKNIRVINTGMPGTNSTLIVERLGRDLDRLRPDVVVFLAGLVNDGMDTRGFDAFIREDTLPARACARLSRLRTARLVRYLLRDLRNTRDRRAAGPAAAALPADDPAGTPPSVIPGPPPAGRSGARFLEGKRRLDEGDYRGAAACMGQALAADPGNLHPVWYLAGLSAATGDSAAALRYYARCLEGPPSVFTDMARWRLGNLYIRLQRYREALVCFRRGVADNPGDSVCYEGIRRLYQLPEAGFLRGEIRVLIDGLRRTAGGRGTRAFLAALERGERSERVMRWRARDLAAAVDLCRERGIRIVLMDYPEHDFDGLYRRVAASRNVPFVDNRSVFRSLLAAHPRAAYISYDDSHCNAAGYGVIARNVFDVLTEEGL